MSQRHYTWRAKDKNTTRRPLNGNLFQLYGRVRTVRERVLGMSCVLSSLLYTSETWTLLKADIAKLEAFHMTNHRRILGILWYEFVTNVTLSIKLIELKRTKRFI